MRKTVVFIVSLGVIAGALSHARAQTGAQRGEWKTYGGDLGHSKYSPLDQINKANVKSLRIAWRWLSVDEEVKKQAKASNSPALRYLNIATYLNETTPLMVHGVLYTSTSYSQIAAIDARTGKTLWSYDPELYSEGRPPEHGFLTRGLTYWTDGKEERLFYAGGLSRLLSVDAKTGKLDPKVRRERTRGSHAGTGPRVQYPDLLRQFSTGHLPRRRDPGVDHAGKRRREGLAARLRPWLRRPHRQDEMDLPHDRAAGRVRRQDVGSRFVGVDRRGQHLDQHERRRGARLRLHAGRHADERFLRRKAARRQSVRRFARLHRWPDGQTHLALPDRAPPDLGLRSARRAES